MTDADHNSPTEPPPPPPKVTEMRPEDFGKTGPLPPVTASDVLTVFQLFQQQILTRIDTRDKNILDAIKKIGSDVFSQYELIAKQGDDNHKQIKKLRKRTHEHATHLQQLEIRVHDIEARLGLPPITPPSHEPEEGLDE